MPFKKFCTRLITGFIKDLARLLYSLRPLSGSSFVKFTVELRNSEKGLINIQNDDLKYFLWCHVRHINLVKIHPERIKRKDKKLANSLNYDGIEFPVRNKDFSKIETKNNICIKVFYYENKLTFPIYVSDQKSENSMDLSYIFDGHKSHYVYIKDFNRFMFHKSKNKSKKYFCLQYFICKNVFTGQKEDCSSINGQQSVRLEKGTITLKIILNKYQLHLKFMLILSLI